MNRYVPFLAVAFMQVMVYVGYRVGTKARIEMEWVGGDALLFLFQMGTIALLAALLAWSIFANQAVNRPFVGVAPSGMLYVCAGIALAFPLNPFFGAATFFAIVGTISLVRFGSRIIKLDSST
jgi:hypothetical protein